MTKKKINYRTTTGSRTVQDVVEDFSARRQWVDKRYQRRVVWESKDTNSYFESVSNGTAVSNIVVADIATGVEASRDAGDDEGVVAYEAALNRGAASTSLDGQNRTEKLCLFINNKLEFSGILWGLDGKPYLIDNKTFANLPETVQNHFLTRGVGVCEMRNVPYRDLPDIFINLQRGCPLEAQEKRNAWQTWLSEKLRTLAEGHLEPMFPKVATMTANKIKRMKDIELLAATFLHLSRVLPSKFRTLSQSCLDHFYAVGIDVPRATVPAYAASEIDRGTEIINLTARLIDDQNKHSGSTSTPFKTYWALVFAATYFYDNDVRVVDYASVYNTIYELDVRLARESKNQQAADNTAYLKSFPKATEDEIAKAHPDDNYYWRRVNRNQTEKLRALREEDFTTELKSLIQSGDVAVSTESSVDVDMTDDECVFGDDDA